MDIFHTKNIDELLDEAALPIGFNPIKFEVRISCDSLEEANYLASYITDGQVGDMDVVDVEEPGILTVEVECESEGDAKDKIQRLIRKAGIRESLIVEVSPPGFSGTLRKMKSKDKIDNPYALAWYMYKKGDKPKEKPESNPKGRKTYIPPEKYKGSKKQESVLDETVVTSNVAGVPWVSPPLYGLEFSKQEQDECIEHVKKLFPGYTKEQLKKMIFGEKDENKNE